MPKPINSIEAANYLISNIPKEPTDIIEVRGIIIRCFQDFGTSFVPNTQQIDEFLYRIASKEVIRLDVSGNKVTRLKDSGIPIPEAEKLRSTFEDEAKLWSSIFDKVRSRGTTYWFDEEEFIRKHFR